MNRVIAKLAVITAFCGAAMSAFAGNLTLKSPTENSYLGLTNSIKFLITGAVVDVDVKLTVTGPGGVTEIEDTFTPNSNGQIDNSLALNFSENTPQGAYTLTLSATEPGNTFTPVTVHVTVDTLKPKFLEFTPRNDSFAKGLVRVRAVLDEDNVKSWEVKANNTAIPNNTGTGNNIAVDWDASGITNDGAQTITITAKDQAGNEATQTIKVTLDRIAPVITVTYPSSSQKVPKGITIPVIVDIVDASTTSVDVTGVDVVVRRLNGDYIMRVSRESFKGAGSTTVRFTGRILPKMSLPQKFNIVVEAIDRAGNRAATQTVQVQLK